MMDHHRITELRKRVEPYERTHFALSVRQMTNTLLPLFTLWALSYVSLHFSYALTIPLVIATAAFMVRTFILQHDCGHASFFRSRRANDILGSLLGVLTFVPYQQWKVTHAIHHATSGNLDRRGIGDLWLMTVEEYVHASPWKRLRYRLYRHPLIMFGLGPTYTFLLEYRWNRRKAPPAERWHTNMTNIGLLGFYALLVWLVGWQAVLLVQVPIFLISSTLGVWLFYVQHQFERSYFEGNEQWDFIDAAVEGSSYYKLPRILQWLTGNIGFHHIHHLSTKIPNYLLEKAHEGIPALQTVTTLTLGTSLRSLRYRLWDEQQFIFVGFDVAKYRLHAKKAIPQND